MLNKGIKLYFTPIMSVALCLGISSGIPLALIASTLSAWLTKAGISKVSIGFLLSLSFPYAIKFLWAPLVDFFSIPFLSNKIGNRRAWLVIVEVLLVCSIILLGNSDPQNFFILSIAVFLVSFFSATHDIIIDSLRVSMLKDDEQGAGASMAVTGYRVGLLISGAGALLFADYLSSTEFYTKNWQITYMLISVVIFIGAISSFFIPNSNISELKTSTADADVIHKIKSSFTNSIFLPFKEFIINHPRWINVIFFVVFFRLADAFIGSMVNPFFIDKGFTLTEIGLVVKSFGFFATIFGAFLGGYITYYLSMRHALLFAILFQIFANSMFMIQNDMGHNTTFLYVLVCIDNISGSISTSTMLAYIAILCKPSKYLATQYALLTSLSVVDRIFLPTIAGIVANFGWFYFFIFSTLLGIPSLIFFMTLDNNKEYDSVVECKQK